MTTDCIQAVIVVSYVKRKTAKLCDNLEAEHTAILYYCEVRWLSRAIVLHGLFELKE